RGDFGGGHGGPARGGTAPRVDATATGSGCPPAAPRPTRSPARDGSTLGALRLAGPTRRPLAAYAPPAPPVKRATVRGMVTVWVLARAGDAGLRSLESAPPGVTFVVGEQTEHSQKPPPADAIFVCSLGRRKLEPVFPLSPALRWVHSRSA